MKVFSKTCKGNMSVSQLARSLARLKMETDEKYDALWVRYTKQMEEDAILIAHLRKQQQVEHRGPSEFTTLAKSLRNGVISKDFLDVKGAFESLFQIVIRRLTPSHQDVDNLRGFRQGIEKMLDDD